MNKKNIPDSKSHNNKPSSSQLAKFTAGAALIASLFITNPSYNQTDTHALRLQQKTPMWLVEKNTRTLKNNINTDSIEHAKIITQDVQEILASYGPEKWMEIIGTHVRIELNNIRQKNNLPKLDYNKKLSHVAQEYAQYLHDNNRHGHKDKTWKWERQRIKDSWYPFEETWEIVAQWFFTIEELITLCLYSQEHLNQANWTYFFDIGVWYDNGYRVVDFGGAK